MQVRKKDTERIYAMKIIRKADVVERNEINHIIAERQVLAQMHHPFIVNLKFSFQTQDKLYMVLSFVNGGELFTHLQESGKFDEYRSKFYVAELLLCLEYLHGYNIIYRFSILFISISRQESSENNPALDLGMSNRRIYYSITMDTLHCVILVSVKCT